MKNYYKILSFILLIGTLFAFYTVVVDFTKFYGLENTLFKINDCLIPNPVTTPCFWGAWGFLIALIWSVKIQKLETEKKFKQIKFLILFLIGGNIFAWSNFGLILKKYFQASGQPTIGCSGQLMTNPINTPCFIGSLIFFIALAWIAIMIIKVKKYDKQN